LITILQAHGTQIAHAEGDFSDPAVPKQIMDKAVQTFGHIDILVANHTYSTMGNLEELTAADIDIHFQVNVRGTLLLTQSFAQQHQKNSGGRVILLTSGQQLNPMPAELAYVASKGGITATNIELICPLNPPRNYGKYRESWCYRYWLG
jgi:3-oxoacyl-[acyl-carrier protein] reductase